VYYSCLGDCFLPAPSIDDGYFMMPSPDIVIAAITYFYSRSKNSGSCTGKSDSFQNAKSKTILL